MRIPLLFCLLFAGCLPSIETTKDTPPVNAEIEVLSGAKNHFRIQSSDRRSLYVSLLKDTLKADRKIILSKAAIKRITDMQGNDLTNYFLAEDREETNTRSIERIAEIQTRYYNAWMIVNLIYVAGIVVAILSVK
jgi:hypothetical protein